jgi:hypothetical protein
LPPKPNNIKNIFDLYRANVFQNSLTGKQNLQREDGSREYGALVFIRR